MYNSLQPSMVQISSDTFRVSAVGQNADSISNALSIMFILFGVAAIVKAVK